MLTSIELFAGIAGFSSPHIEPIAFVESDPSCRMILRRHHPGALILEDVRTSGRHNLPWAPVVKGGWPCQDVSVAGLRAGLIGKRSGLFYQYVRIVNEMKPDFAVFENVPGLLSGKYGQYEYYFSCICGWVSGWRGLYHSNGESEAVSLSGVLHGDERKGAPDFDNGSTRIWGEFEAGKSGNTKMVSGDDLDDHRQQPCTLPGDDSPPPHLESRAMQHGVDFGLPNPQSTGQIQRADMDTEVCGSRTGYGRSNISPQPQGANEGVDNGLCPLCRRTLGTPATRHVQRTWMGDVLGAMADIGYFGSYRVLNAEFFGVAQRRRRIFGVFARRDIGATRCAEILSLIPGMSGHSPAGGKARANVAATIRGGAAGDGTNRPGRRGDDDQNIVAATLGAAFGRNRGLGQENEIDTLVIPFDTAQITSNVNRTRAEPGLPASTLNGSGQMHVAVFGGNNTSGERGGNAALTAHPTGRYDFETENLVAATLNSGGNNGGFRTEPGEHLVVGTLSAHSKAHGHAMTTQQAAESGQIVYALQHAQIGRADDAGPQAKGYQEGIAFTQDTRSEADAVASSFGVRRLTPRECERLQGFEDDWTAWGIDESGQRVEMSDSARYRMTGNAVCRAVSAWLDRRIARYGYD